jgi:hypothetical protein
MSRLAGRPLNVASRTTFDALEVDIGEESEEEEVHEVAPMLETFVLCSHPLVLVLSSHDRPVHLSLK